MKFLCLSYWDQRRFDLMSESEREIFIKECFAYDKVLRRDGHFVRLEVLQSARSARPCTLGAARRPSPMVPMLRPKNK
jgi:hypothetical protein